MPVVTSLYDEVSASVVLPWWFPLQNSYIKLSQVCSVNLNLCRVHIIMNIPSFICASTAGCEVIFFPFPIPWLFRTIGAEKC